MPSITAHMVVAQFIFQRIDIDFWKFIQGNLLPDIIDSIDSHHRIQGKCFLVPDLAYFKKHLDFSNPLCLGYYAHLLLDYYFLEEFVPVSVSDLNVFMNGTMYLEYSLINYSLVQRFSLDVALLERILNSCDEAVYPEKLTYNISCLKNSKIGNTKYLNIESFSSFLLDVSDIIGREIERVYLKNKKAF